MLRYAVGVMKGSPLSRGGNYKIVKRNGEMVAQFSGGAMARFYDDGLVDDPAPVLTQSGGVAGTVQVDSSGFMPFDQTAKPRVPRDWPPVHSSLDRPRSSKQKVVFTAQPWKISVLLFLAKLLGVRRK